MADQIQNMSEPAATPAWGSRMDHPAAPPPPVSRPEPTASLEAFIGGSPLQVLFRLVILSLIVGAGLMWLNIRPGAIIAAVERIATRFWFMGFDAIREAGDYVLAGALVVVPVWFLLRLMNFRSGR